MPRNNWRSSGRPRSSARSLPLARQGGVGRPGSTPPECLPSRLGLRLRRRSPPLGRGLNTGVLLRCRLRERSFALFFHLSASLYPLSSALRAFLSQKRGHLGCSQYECPVSLWLLQKKGCSPRPSWRQAKHTWTKHWSRATHTLFFCLLVLPISQASNSGPPDPVVNSSSGPPDPGDEASELLCRTESREQCEPPRSYLTPNRR